MNIVTKKNKRGIAYLIGMLLIMKFMLQPFHAFGRDDDRRARLMVGVINAPPFAMKTANGQWEGLSIDLWHMIARELAVDFELLEYNSIPQILDAMEKDVLDLVVTAAIMADREIILDFSNPYFRSGSAIAVSTESTGFNWLHLTERFFSPKILKVMGHLILLLLFVGAVVWLLERRRNREMFGEKPVEGIGHGVWWAAVTMTTVGYGDKSPRTLGGRMAAVLWMFASIILVSVLTATITASLTISELNGKVRGRGDLHSVRVGSVDQSATLTDLLRGGIVVLPFADVRDGLQAIIDGRIEAFVYNEAILKYLVSTQFPTRLRVLPETFDHYFVSMAMPPGSPIREEINQTLLNVMATSDWFKLRDRYLGPGR